jgi:hypothetical protein
MKVLIPLRDVSGSITKDWQHSVTPIGSASAKCIFFDVPTGARPNAIGSAKNDMLG